MNINELKNKTIFFVGLETGDEDYMHEQFGGFNITKARRLCDGMSGGGIPAQIGKLTRAEIEQLCKDNDVSETYVQQRVMTDPSRMRVPLIAITTESGINIIIDGFHRLKAMLNMAPPEVDPLHFYVHIIPYPTWNLFRVYAVVKHEDGTLTYLDPKDILEESRGKYAHSNTVGM